MFDLWSKCWKVWCQSIVKYTRLLFGVKIMWVAFSFFRMTLQKTDEKLQQNLEREVLVCQICYLGSSTYHQSFKGSDHGFISFLSLSYRSSNVSSSMWLPAFWEHGFLCCWLKILGKKSLKKHKLFTSEKCQNQFGQGPPSIWPRIPPSNWAMPKRNSVFSGTSSLR